MCYTIGLGVVNQYNMRLLRTSVDTWTNLLQAAGTPAGHAAERPYEADDLSVHVVLDLHVEAAQRAAAVPGAAVVLLFGLVDLLAQAVLYLILVIGLEPDECWAGLEGEGQKGKGVEMVNGKVKISKEFQGQV